MSLLFVLLLCVTIATCRKTNPSTCDDFQAKFNLDNVIGKWQLQAIVPHQYYPKENIKLDEVEFSKMTDEKVMHELYNMSLHENRTLNQNSIILRQRFFTEHEFDILSVPVANVSGCYYQALVRHGNKTLKDYSKGSTMQLHFTETATLGPVLVQMLYGQTISAVVFRRTRKQGVKVEDLEPIMEMLNKLRGLQKTPILF